MQPIFAFYANGVSIGGIILGLILAAIVYLGLTHFVPAIPTLLSGLVALLVFLAAAGLV